ncbi:putative NRPS-like protein biosynthetic cluster [Claviceps sp. LM218 group G6]|nr:putative NRPS-like protein biosynthetic cluster [Claviceps sp. LM218 group G6]
MVLAYRRRICYTVNLSKGLKFVTPIRFPLLKASTCEFALILRSKTNATLLLRSRTVSKDVCILLHFNSHVEYVEWFWSVIAAGGVPVVSTPLASDPAARRKHLDHIDRLLEHPKILTSMKLVGELTAIDMALDLVLVEQLPVIGHPEVSFYPHSSQDGGSMGAEGDSDLAFLMLTSGSTGNAKAVECGHAQTMISMRGKSNALKSTNRDIFLNWIGFDHVACVTETHIHAVAVGADQILVAPSLLLARPVMFWEKLAEHKVTIAFAPNFFLALAVRELEKPSGHGTERPQLGSLCDLRHVVSGGEANVVSTGNRFNEAVASLGGPEAGTLRTAFGMTETLGAVSYHQDFPSFEEERDLQFCSVGQGVSGLSFRFTDDEGIVLPPETDGNLELFGPVVFKRYFKDVHNTMLSFTTDGWFKTGDKGRMTASGKLILNGRAKDSIILNGVKYFSHEIESALEDASILGLVPSFIASFDTWPRGSDSEEYVILALETEDMKTDDAALALVVSQVSKQAVLYCAKKPMDIIPLPRDMLPKSALGKLSRPKLKQQFEEGRFDTYSRATTQRLSAFHRSSRKAPSTDNEHRLLHIFAEEFGLDPHEVGVNDSLTDMGVDSIRVIRYKNLVQKKLALQAEIPLIHLLQNPSIEGLAAIVDGMTSSTGSALAEYNPIIQLQSGESLAPPIFFFHPGLGEILVFLNLSKFFSDRRVYAIRAPGFNPGEKMHKSVDHMTDVYWQAIRDKQPHGPYVLIGYSFGAMIAFEVAKKMEAAGDKVGFIGTLNLPPHIKFRMIELDWTELVLNLVYFLGFISEETAHAWSPELHKLSRDEVLQRIMAIAPSQRLLELDLTESKLRHWAEVSSQLQGLAHDYDPSGHVSTMDVFYAVPLIAVGRDKDQWLRDHLLAWREYVGDVKFHDVPGSHYTMMNTENVFALQKSLRAAMKQRGVL